MIKSIATGIAVLAAYGPLAAQTIATGPEVGERIPAFEAADQRGERQTFDSLTGPNGLLLLMHRSADW
jgi:hypothetical protein